jgi:hypothetical protein
MFLFFAKDQSAPFVLKSPCQRNYFLRGEETVEVGGVFWTYRQLLSGSLSMEEGIRFTGRIFVGQVVQVIVTVIGVVYGIEWVKWLGDTIDEVRDEYAPKYTPDEIKQIPNSEWVAISQADLRLSEDAMSFLIYWPERW